MEGSCMAQVQYTHVIMDILLDVLDQELERAKHQGIGMDIQNIAIVNILVFLLICRFLHHAILLPTGKHSTCNLSIWKVIYY